MSPRDPVEPIYIPGRFLTAVSPSSTCKSEAVYVDSDIIETVLHEFFKLPQFLIIAKITRFCKQNQCFLHYYSKYKASKMSFQFD